MHDDRGKKDVQPLMDIRGFSASEAQSFLARQENVESVRAEAEQILGHRLPEVISSAFIEEFCLVAPQIGLCGLKYNLDTESSHDDWRFLVELYCDVNAHYAGEWFKVGVVPYGGDVAPVSSLRVACSPAQALVDFVREYGSRLERYRDHSALADIPEEDLYDSLPVLVTSIGTCVCQVEASDRAPGLNGSSGRLADVFSDPEVVPPFVPRDGYLHDIRLAYGLKPYDVEREIAFQELKDATEDRAVITLMALVERLFRSLGEARPIVEPDSSYDTYRQFRAESSESTDSAQRRVALLYFQSIEDSGLADSRDDIQARIDGARAEAAMHIKKIDQQLAEPSWKEMQQLLLERREFFSYVQNALESNRDFIASFFSS